MPEMRRGDDEAGPQVVIRAFTGRVKAELHVSAIKQAYGLKPRIELKRQGVKLFAPRLLERVTKERKDPNAHSF
jgi:hypothetical protein